ncbi:MAG: Gfo/Idh/MocA family oxidoreductase [Chloroflexota bacterium]
MKIGMISYAHGHAGGYTQALQNRSDVTIAGLYDDDAQRATRVGAQYDLPVFTDLQDLLSQGLDGVIICSENAKHRQFVELAAGQTKAILCEKPIATNLPDAQAMIDICEAKQTKLQIAFPVRFAEPIVELKKHLDEQALGRIFSAKCTNHGGMPGDWFIKPALSGGGAVIDHTVHVIDLLRWFWQTEVTEVYAEIGDSLLHPNLGIDDAGMLSFTLANGIYGTLDTSWSRPKSYPTWGDVKIDLVGEKGRIQVDAFRQHLSLSSEQTGKTDWIHWGFNPDQGLVDDFIAMMIEDREPSITGWDGLKALEVALAAYDSARLGQPVSLH